MKAAAMRVLVLMGSESDMQVMEETATVLRGLGISHEMTVASAHRSPERVTRLIADAERKGAKAIIAGAGMAAHLAGAVAAHTTIPVIGVPINSSPLNGLDALLSTVQMPPGIPVATVAIGKAGARNAAYLAAGIIATSEPGMRKTLKALRVRMARDIEKKALALSRPKGPRVKKQ